MTRMDCGEVRDLLHLYIDDELPWEERQTVERHLADCPACAKALADLQELRERIHGLDTHGLPGGLDERLRAAIGLEAGGRPPLWRRATLTAATHIAALVVGGMLAATVFMGGEAREEVVHDVMQAHVRALIADQLVQVASNETHTVKPWFLGKIPYAPTVRNIDDQGFPLLGARVDYVLGRPAAAIVYGRRKHRINLFILPADQAIGPRTFAMTRDGFNMVVWRAGAFAYFAASDLNAKELQEFAALLQKPG